MLRKKMAMFAWAVATLFFTTSSMAAPVHHTHSRVKTTTPTTIHKIKRTVAIKKNRRRHLAQRKSKSHAYVNHDAESQLVANLAPANIPVYTLSSPEKRVVDFIDNTLTNLHYSSYKLGGTKIDTERGIYVVDCSSYVDHILKNVYPDAFGHLVSWSGTEKPTSDDYFHYFTELTNRAQKHWDTISEVSDMRPGDILVFRYTNRSGYETGGHVMIVMDKPIQMGNSYGIRVSDAASGRHSGDTRAARESGIGVGTLLLRVDPRNKDPIAFAWSTGSRWQNKVQFAMGRPLQS